MLKIVVTHEMTFVRDVGVRVVYMDTTKTADGAPRDVLANPSHDWLKTVLARIKIEHS